MANSSAHQKLQPAYTLNYTNLLPSSSLGQGRWIYGTGAGGVWGRNAREVGSILVCILSPNLKKNVSQVDTITLLVHLQVSRPTGSRPTVINCSSNESRLMLRHPSYGPADWPWCDISPMVRRWSDSRSEEKIILRAGRQIPTSNDSSNRFLSAVIHKYLHRPRSRRGVLDSALSPHILFFAKLHQFFFFAINFI